MKLKVKEYMYMEKPVPFLKALPPKSGTKCTTLQSYQWYHPSHDPSQPIIGEPSSGLVHCGQYHTSPPGLTATGGSVNGSTPLSSNRGVACCRGGGNNGNSSFGSFIWGILEPPLLDDLPELHGYRDSVSYPCR